MSNHYHLLIETPDSNLSKGMRQLNGVYTQSYNRIHNRVGHVFQGRFKAILVEKETCLLELARYIVLNPVRAGMARAAKDWPWSSYRATTGQVQGLECVNTDGLLAAFGKRKSTAIEQYKVFVAEGKGEPSPWAKLRHQVYLGSPPFVEKMQSLIDGDKELSEIPSSQRRSLPRTLVDYKLSNADRNTAICKAYQSGGYTSKAIGEHFDLHYSTVSGIVRDNKSKTWPHHAYELFVITVMTYAGDELRNWGFAFILTGYHRVTLLANSADNLCCSISISKLPAA
jgi:putative transposase